MRMLDREEDESDAKRRLWKEEKKLMLTIKFSKIEEIRC